MRTFNLVKYHISFPVYENGKQNKPKTRKLVFWLIIAEEICIFFTDLAQKGFWKISKSIVAIMVVQELKREGWVYSNLFIPPAFTHKTKKQNSISVSSAFPR